MKSILCLAVGKVKTPHWLQAAGHYAKLLGRFVDLEQGVVKDGAGHLSPRARNAEEGASLLAKLGSRDLVLGMDARGRCCNSEEFALLLQTWLEDPIRRPCFVLGGAYGLAPEVTSRCDILLSLGPMTLPHELARVVLLEQLYRAMTIIRGTGYHH